MLGKHEPRFFEQIALLEGISPTNCLVVGDSITTDGVPSALAGMTAIIVSGPDELIEIINQLKTLKP